MFQCLLPFPTFHLFQYHGIPLDHISRWHLVEHFPSVLHAHIRHTCQLSYFPQTQLNPIHLQQSAHEHAGHLQVQWHWHMHSALPWKSESGRTPSCWICWNSFSAFCACPHFTCPKIITFQVNILRFFLFLEHSVASSMLPHFAYMSTKLLPTKTSALQPLWMICSWVCLLSSIACKLAHAFRVSYTCKSWQSLHLLGGGFNANFDLTHYGWYCNLSENFHGSAITLHAFECLL
jgi:hypothetical protein